MIPQRSVHVIHVAESAWLGCRFGGVCHEVQRSPRAKNECSQLIDPIVILSSGLATRRSIVSALLNKTLKIAEQNEVERFAHAVSCACPQLPGCVPFTIFHQDTTPERILNSVSVLHPLMLHSQNLPNGKFRSTLCLNYSDASSHLTNDVSWLLR